MNSDFDVIVVGAGFAGVTAARELETQGKRTLLLEARDRLGGRTWTDTFAGKRLEIGGTWVHWMQPHVWAEITRYGIPIVEDDPPERCILASGTGLGSFGVDEAFSRLAELSERFFEGAREYLDRPYDPLFREDAMRELDKLSLHDRFEQSLPVEEQAWLSGMFSMLAGAPTSQGAFTMLARWWALSGWSFELMWDCLSRYRFEQGTIALLEAMLAHASAEVRLSSPVASIVDDGQAVRVTTRAGERFSAGAAVVAVPANVWPTIEFTPGLADARLAASARGIGARHGTKVWVHARGDLSRVYAQPPEGYPMTILLTYAELDDGQLLACFGGDPSFDVGDRAQIEDGVRQVLPEAEVIDVRGHDWVKDEFSLGAWSFMQPGQLTSHLHAMQQPQGRLVFATSDVASGWSGFIDGAIESGLLAGRQVGGLRVDGRLDARVLSA